ncbi:hypothetical protein [Dyella silvatica]|nr:hypothetical protein [Dyella silvatica]
MNSGTARPSGLGYQVVGMGLLVFISLFPIAWGFTRLLGRSFLHGAVRG